MIRARARTSLQLGFGLVRVTRLEKLELAILNEILLWSLGALVVVRARARAKT